MTQRDPLMNCFGLGLVVKVQCLMSETSSNVELGASTLNTFSAFYPPVHLSIPQN